MEKEFVTYEIASALKELGFDEPCIRGWDKNGKIWYHPDSDIVLDNPTFSQAFRCFREKYKLVTWVYCSNESNGYFAIILAHKRLVLYDAQFNTYEEAELACLKKLIEIVKNGNKS